ncbi:MAG: serine protease [Patescibacteria group bacterium]
MSKLSMVGVLYFVILVFTGLALPITIASATEIDDLIDEVRPAIVCIYCQDIDGDSIQGSGVIVSANGVVVTSAHVVDEAVAISVYYYDISSGDLMETVAEVASVNLIYDLALVDIPGDFVPADVDHLFQPRLGDRVVTASFPASTVMGIQDIFVAQGSIIGFMADADQTRSCSIVVDAAIGLGSSGGGLFNTAGELMGIIYGKGSGGIEGMNFVLPIYDIYVWSGTSPELGIGYAIDTILEFPPGINLLVN